ncbi:MAG: hypothetical protein BVN28_00175 [Nitrospira sp. ST-bin4]|nr:MAG: hypothetical protein BVN28_00175 [Nitrospira sp. ST-bin4]
MLYELYDYIEHKFVLVHDMLSQVISLLTVDTAKICEFDFLAGDLIARALRQLKLTRVAIIYLSLVGHVQEWRRENKRAEGKLCMPMILHTWNDDWKLQN